MYFHAPFGSMKCASSAAHQLYERRKEFRGDENRLFVLQHVAICLRFAGDCELSRSILSDIAVAAPKLGMVSLACRALCRLAYIHLDIDENNESAWAVLDHAETINVGDRYIIAHIEYNRARILAERGDYAQSVRHLEIANRSAPFRSEPKADSYSGAVELAVSSISGDRTLLQSLVDDRLRRFGAAKSFTGQDYPVYQLLRAMRICGLESHRGREIINAYLTSRREQSDIPNYLRREIAVWN
jgi:hypothetical protein